MILQDHEHPAAEVIHPGGSGGVCLVCEHASAMIPAALNDLGLDPEHRHSHAAWDPGALAVAKAMSALLDAPLVASRVSRLVYDCNRPPDAPDAMPARSEVIDVPGNLGLSTADKAARVAEVYDPFRNLLTQTLTTRPTLRALVTIHSFTPVWNGTPRDVELGLLHDSDDRLAKAMLGAAPKGINTQLNAPYSARDGVTHTLKQHGVANGLPNVMVEIRNDLIADTDGITRFATALTTMLTHALTHVRSGQEVT